MKAVLAIDLGATSGRAILYWLEEEGLQSKEVHRFSNRIHTVRGQLAWDLQSLVGNLLESIERARKSSQLLSVGIDSWGVDFVLLDANGQAISDPVSYRDGRTVGILDKIAAYASLEELYYQTGNQLMEINSLFQLVACKEETPASYYKANKILMVSDYLNYLLTGKFATESSIASTMQLVNPLTRDWHKEVLQTFEISELLLAPLVSEGHILGNIQYPSASETVVINVCQHDTASAVAAIPHVAGQPLLYISCGTWSLIGTELAAPILTKEALEHDFTNEAGYDGTIRFLKNCTGLWILEELRESFRQQGQALDYEQIVQLVEEERAPVPIIDTDDSDFARPGNMLEKICRYAEKEGLEIPRRAGFLFKLVYHSLAAKYHQVIAELEELVGVSYPVIHLIGGGSRSAYFAQLIADRTGKEVLTGLYEATSLGNALVQLKALGYVKDMAEAKELVRKSIICNHYHPKEEEKNDTLS